MRRNRLRRRIREVFRLNRANLPGGWDLLVNPREAVGKVSFTTLTRELLKLLRPDHERRPMPPKGGECGGSADKR